MRYRKPVRAALIAVTVAALGCLVGAFANAADAHPSRYYSHASFVTRHRSELRLYGHDFRFAAANMYWLGLSESPTVRYPTTYEVDDAMATANELGLTVVRSHTLGDTVGCPLCLEPTLGQFSSTAFQAIDYAIKSAHDHGIKLIIPLVDHGAYYEGGIGTYTGWRGLSDPNAFYTDPTVISDFEQHIAAVLNHVNSYTGVALKDDPTVLAWEEGNELSAPAGWVQTIANYIRGIDDNHLVAYGALHGLQSDTLSSSVDIEDVHYYPPSVAALNSDAAAVTAADKVYVAGEFDWTGQHGGDALADFLTAAAANDDVAGDAFWSLFPHAAGGGYVQHGDGYTLHYPGDTTDMAMRAQLIRTHAYAMSGRWLGAHQPPGTPVLLGVDGAQLTWRGATLGYRYQIQRSVTSATGPWTTVCDLCASDNDVPWTDAHQLSGTDWYRVRAANVDGVLGGWSNVVSVSVTEPPTLVDNLDNLLLTYAHSAQVGIDTSNLVNFDGDAGRANRHVNDAEWIVWRKPNLDSMTAVVWYWQNEPIAPFEIDTSADGTTWTPATPTVTEGRTPPNGTAWRVFTYQLTGVTGANFVKIVWTDAGPNAWTPQIGQVTLHSA
jgi:mannan endo-1,4-beta-mannosidase